MLGVDWLDMIKGIPQKILAFEKFLEESPNWRSKVVLLQIAVPSRTNVPEYQKFTSQLHEIVGCINGKYGTITAVPIHHLDRSVDFHELCALYAVTDVALVTSLRDGMNLISYEFVSCQAPKKGVLILSEFAGAAQSLGSGAILGFNTTLTEPVDGNVRTDCQIKEMELKLHPALREPLKKLCDDPKTTIIVLSGSSRNVLENQRIGMFLRSPLGEWKNTMPENLNVDWLDSLKHVFKYFTERTPRSHFEFNETTLKWNYKYADQVFGRLQARDLLQHLWTGPISKAPVEVVLGSQSVEVRPVGFPKGAVIDRILGDIIHGKCMKESVDCLLCIGHFLVKDEDIYTFFESGLSAEAPIPDKTSASKSPQKEGVEGGMPASLELFEVETANYFSCAVARQRSKARYLLGSSDDVATLLKQLAGLSPPNSPD
ncbi:hypothetical protein SLE2022_388280 [Rubroshorea leprosula]